MGYSLYSLIRYCRDNELMKEYFKEKDYASPGFDVCEVLPGNVICTSGICTSGDIDDLSVGEKYEF